MSFSITDII